MLVLAKTFANCRLYMAGITQNKQKCAILIMVHQCRKNLIKLDQNEEKIHIKK